MRRRLKCSEQFIRARQSDGFYLAALNPPYIPLLVNTVFTLNGVTYTTAQTITDPAAMAAVLRSSFGPNCSR